MSAPPDVRTVRAVLARVQRRLHVRAALAGTAIGVVATTVLCLVVPGWRAQTFAFAIIAVGGIAGALTAAHRARRSLVDVALALEARAPRRNVVVTAAELIAAPGRVPPYIAARGIGDAARSAATVDVAAAVPLRRAAWTTVAALAACALTLAATRISTRAGLPTSDGDVASDREPAITAIAVHVVPPEYVAAAPETIADPARIDALAGSRLHITVDGEAAFLTLATADGDRRLDAGRDRRFVADLALDADGFVSITPHATDGRTGARRLIGLVATPDPLPRVRLVQPDRDLVVADANRRIEITVAAEDDRALQTLDLRFTKVSGSGENFTFADGELPIAVTRSSASAWTGRGTLDLTALQLEPGDMVMYRGRAADRRPGAPLAESETLIIEIAAPGAIAGDGFAIDDREDRYAVSQQMVIVKTERLLAGRASMPAEAVVDAARTIAAEQRQVRAEFVFMMGGELADAGIDISTLNEHEEAERETDLAAGYLVNQGRADLIRAIRAMSRAAVMLNETVELDQALAAEKSALTYLQRAFTRARYLVRTLTTRERLELSRRVSGDLAALATLRLPAAPAAPAPRAIALRALLARLAAVPADAPATVTAAALTDAAETLLRLDAASGAVRDAAAQLTTAATAMSASADAAAARHAIDAAVLSLSELLRRDTPLGAARTPSLGERQLRGALADALRAGGPGR